MRNIVITSVHMEKEHPYLKKSVDEDTNQFKYSARNTGMDQENVVFMHNGILCSHEEERNVNGRNWRTSF
jgi:hypothetical protein